jgi:hypothetical protein
MELLFISFACNISCYIKSVNKIAELYNIIYIDIITHVGKYHISLP